MFILYAIVLGAIVALLLGRDLTGVGDLRFRWAPLIVAGLIVQVVLFSDPVTAVIGPLGPPIYVASTAAVLAAVGANWRVTGVPVIVSGAAANLAAIVANGGYMPAGTDAMAALDKHAADVYSNSAVIADPALQPLTDVFALPTWIPFANVFSIGDVLIGIGVTVVIVAAARRRPRRGQPGPDGRPTGAVEQLPLPASSTGTDGP